MLLEVWVCGLRGLLDRSLNFAGFTQGGFDGRVVPGMNFGQERYWTRKDSIGVVF